MLEGATECATEYATIDTRERFDNALKSLVTECCRAWDHWTLLLHLNDSTEEYLREFSQTPFFWNVVLRSLQDVAILRIATLLDPRKDVVSVPNILRIIKINAPSNGSKLGIELDDFDKVKIDDDIKSVHKLDPLVDKILTMRNDFLAHRSINIVATHRINLLPELKNAEVTAMLDVLYEIATKYAMLYGQHRTMRSMIGSDDYESLLDALRKGLDLSEM
jgi:hypothetical protein